MPGVGGMILTWENRITWGKVCSIATLSTTIPTVFFNSGRAETLTRLQAEGSGFESGRSERFFPFSKTSKPAVGPIQTPITLVPGLFVGGRLDGAWRCPRAPNSEVKNVWSYTFPPPYMPSWHGLGQQLFYILIHTADGPRGVRLYRCVWL